MIFNKTHYFRCSVSFDLIDLAGVVYHPHYLVLCERARHHALKQAGYAVEDMMRDGYAFPIRENHSEYFRPIFLGENVVILTDLQEVIGARLKVVQTLIYEKDFTSLMPNVSHLSDFLDRTDIPCDEKKILHRLSLTLVCATLHPLKISRFPKLLIEALQLPEPRK